MATFIIVVGLVALASGFQFATSGVATGRGETVASFLAEQRLEQLKAIAMTNYYGSPACRRAHPDAGRRQHRDRVLPDHQHRRHGHELPGDRDHRGGVLRAHHADHGQPGRHRLHRGGAAALQANPGQRDLSTGDDPRRRRARPVRSTSTPWWRRGTDMRKPLTITRDQRGFTLTELLVACALIGLVMAGSVRHAPVRAADVSDRHQPGRGPAGPPPGPAPDDERDPRRRLLPDLWDGLAGASANFDAITAQSATTFTVQNDWNGTWNGTTGIFTGGTVPHVVLNTDGTTTTTNRGEQVTYTFSAGNADPSGDRHRRDTGRDRVRHLVAHVHLSGHQWGRRRRPPPTSGPSS